jgi:hypothetical protein
MVALDLPYYASDLLQWLHRNAAERGMPALEKMANNRIKQHGKNYYRPYANACCYAQQFFFTPCSV